MDRAGEHCNRRGCGGIARTGKRYCNGWLIACRYDCSTNEGVNHAGTENTNQEGAAGAPAKAADITGKTATAQRASRGVNGAVWRGTADPSRGGRSGNDCRCAGFLENGQAGNPVRMASRTKGGLMKKGRTKTGKIRKGWHLDCTGQMVKQKPKRKRQTKQRRLI